MSGVDFRIKLRDNAANGANNTSGTGTAKTNLRFFSHFIKKIFVQITKQDLKLFQNWESVYIGYMQK